MRRVALGLALGLGFAAPSFAADIIRPVIVPPVVVKSPFDGFYAGGHVGYGRGNQQGCWAIFEFPAPSS